MPASVRIINVRTKWGEKKQEDERRALKNSISELRLGVLPD